ncbi:MAG: DUF2271 domain-containing protein [Firmicutes bacterium]|nr:DUF2271 domain-containing protein [Bacillota bacterium]
MILIFSLCACSSGRQNEPSVSPAQTGTPPAPSTASKQPDNSTEPDAPENVSGEVVITFDYERQSGSASNQYAVWIEDMDGNYINTVYATQWTATGGYTSRPDSIALWVEKSSIAAMPDYYVDAISGATPRSSGSQSYTWNLKDINGDTVSFGKYKFYVEGTLRWKNYVLYSGVIEINDVPATVQADADFIYEASDRQSALTSDSTENKMIGAVTAKYNPHSDN